MAVDGGYPVAPEPVERVREREAVMATAEFPDVPLELHRGWLERGEEWAVTVGWRHGAVVLETPGSVAGRLLDPPGLVAEAVEPDGVSAEGEDDRLSAGLYPAHLPLTFEPKLVERARPHELREDYGIPNSVFAPDTRYIFQDTSFPWCTAGRVETAGGTCTGTMIGRRLMVTGSHCIQWLESGAGWVKFTPAYYNGATPFGIAWGTRVIYWRRADGSDGLSDLETAFDYVVVVLDRNLGDLTGYVGYRTYTSSWNNGSYWQQIGYPGDLSGAQRPAFFAPGAITSVQSQTTSGQEGYVLGHFMDTFAGHSGGPYWGWWGQEQWPRLIGTDSTSPQRPGNDTSGDNEAGGGPALSALISYARQNYP
jgi:V8-like Glu-specific endopeptidase